LLNQRNPSFRPLTTHADDYDIALGDIKTVSAITSMSKSHIYAQVREGRFPPPVIKQKRLTRWALVHVRAYIAERIADAAQKAV
jgi:predicted DNA-binding transcriptional regulator AlpA